MNTKTLLGAVLASALFASGAYAATITNNESQPQTVKVYSSDRSENYTIMPSDTLEIQDNLCPTECVLSLQNGDEYDFARGDELVLEEGGVYMTPPAQGGASEGDQPRQQ